MTQGPPVVADTEVNINQAGNFTPPELVTDPCRVFLGTIAQALALFEDIRVRLIGFDALILENYKQWLREQPNVVDDGGVPVEDLDAFALRDMEAKLRTGLAVLVQHGPFLLQTILTRIYDAFLLYLVDLLELVHRTWMAATRLDDARLEQYLRELVERQRTALASAGRKNDLFKEYKDRLDVPIFPTDASRRREKWIAEIRNTIVHNLGIVNAKLKREIPDFPTPLVEGQPIPLTIQSVYEDLEFLAVLVVNVDRHAAERFGLPRLHVPTSVESSEETAAPPDSPPEPGLPSASSIAQVATTRSASDDADKYMEALQRAMGGGAAYLAGAQDDPPANPDRWGWRRDDDGWIPQGERIGWANDRFIYLDPSASYTVAAKYSSSPLRSELRLWKQLKRRGLLAATDPARETLRVRRILGGQRRTVLQLDITAANWPLSENPKAELSV